MADLRLLTVLLVLALAGCNGGMVLPERPQECHLLVNGKPVGISCQWSGGRCMSDTYVTVQVGDEIHIVCRRADG